MPLDDDILIEDIADVAPPTDAALGRIAALAMRQRSEEREAMALTAQLQAALARLRQTREVDLPEAMRAVGMSKFALTDGTEVKIEDKLTGAKLTSPPALAWVDEHGGSSLIKTTIALEMDRGDVEAAREILTELRQNKHANRFKRLELEESIHAMTIAKFAREMVEQGEDPPLELLGVHRRVAAIVGKRPKSVELTGLASRERNLR